MKIRVAHTITRLAGGPAFRTDVLLRGLDPGRFETCLFFGRASSWEGESQDALVSGGHYTRVFIPWLQRELAPVEDARALVALVKAFQAFRPHIVHTHESKDGVLARLAAIRCGVPVIIRQYHGFIYGTGYFQREANRMTPVYLAVERLLNRSTDAIINLSEGLNRQASQEYRLGDPRKMVVINDAFDLTELRPDRRDGTMRLAWGIPANSRVFVMAGIFQRPKNHAGGVRAFGEFVKRHPTPEPHLVLAGQGPLEGEIRQLVCELGLEDRVHFLGHRTDVPSVLAASDVFVLSSTSEGTPGVLIEALAAGLPVACTDVGGVADVTLGQERAALAPPWDDAALCAAMERAVFATFDGRSTPDRRAIAAEVEREYGVAAVAAKTMALYESLVARKGALAYQG
ncbi:glycosyltransferase [Myxococcota bacterium]|nr:glycosyltransferase [Myxococcota bacterium]